MNHGSMVASGHWHVEVLLFDFLVHANVHDYKVDYVHTRPKVCIAVQTSTSESEAACSTW